MSLLERETSVHGGRPLELYEFTLGLTAWRFTSADHAVDAHGGVYTPVPIGRDAISMTDEVPRAGLTVRTSRDNPFVAAFIAGTAGRLASLTLYRGHQGEDDFMVFWKGRVATVVFKGAEAQLPCESIFTSLKRQGLRARYQVLCRHALYGTRCGVSSANFKVTGTVAAVSGATLTVPAAAAYPDGWFTAGFLRHGDTVYRTVEGHAAATLVLDRPVPNLAAGATVRVFPGCDHSSTHCRDKFGNLVNFGGFEFIPLRNPFSSLGSNLL